MTKKPTRLTEEDYPDCVHCGKPLNIRYKHFWCTCGWEGHRFNKTKRCPECGEKNLRLSPVPESEITRPCFIVGCPNPIHAIAEPCRNCGQRYCGQHMDSHGQCYNCRQPLIRWNVEQVKLLKEILKEKGGDGSEGGVD